MALAVSITNTRENHQLIALTLANETVWRTITFPDWVDGAEIINSGASDIYLSTDVEDGATGTGGVLVPAGSAYAWRAGGSDPVFMAVRHAIGATYDIGLALRSRGND